jgi:hypothetical protein
VQELSTADLDERSKILDLTNSPVQRKMELSPRQQEIEIDYDLIIKNI